MEGYKVRCPDGNYGGALKEIERAISGLLGRCMRTGKSASKYPALRRFIKDWFRFWVESFATAF